MRIALNLLYMIPGVNGGTETYARGLLEGFEQIGGGNEYLLFLSEEAAAWPLPPAPFFKRIVCPVKAVSRGRRYWYEQVHLPGLLKEHRVDLVHSLGYVCPLYAPCPSVVTIHDLNYKHVQMPLLKKWALRFFVSRGARRSTRIIAVSDASRREIEKELNIPEGKVVACLSAPRTWGNPADGGPSAVPPIAGPYIVAFSSTSSNKNLPRLLQAFQRAREKMSLSHKLVLIGWRPPDGVLGTTGSEVHFTGVLSDTDVRRVLRGAELLAFPSLYEGFGLPVLEAMQEGVPVICSRVTSLPEVAGDAAVYMDPLSVDNMAETLAAVISDPELRSNLRRKGFENLKRFSWKKTATEALQVYQECLIERLPD
jgi:glycosyltransferase involved in cell wall biosynthesis